MAEPKARPPSTTMVVTQRGGQWSSATRGCRVFYLDSGLFYCQPSTPSSSWQCHHGGPGMGGVLLPHLLTTIPLMAFPSSYRTRCSRHWLRPCACTSRTIDRRRVTCLAFSGGSDQGNTWCILATGQFAYFWSSGGSTQPGPQKFDPRVSGCGPGERLCSARGT